MCTWRTLVTLNPILSHFPPTPVNALPHPNQYFSHIYVFFCFVCDRERTQGHLCDHEFRNRHWSLLNSPAGIKAEDNISSSPRIYHYSGAQHGLGLHEAALPSMTDSWQTQSCAGPMQVTREGIAWQQLPRERSGERLCIPKACLSDMLPSTRLHC